MKLPKLPFWAWPLSGIVVALGVYGILWLPRFVTSGAEYCLSCHGTGDTANVGQASLVHPSYSQVGCTSCHAKPGQPIYVEGYRGGYSANPKEVSARCQSCHKDILDKAPSEFKFNVMDIEIPHRFHVETVGAQCTDCHRNVAHDLRPEPTNRPTMGSCSSCHSIGGTATAGSAPVSGGNSCLKCHSQGVPSASFFLAAPPAEPLKALPAQASGAAAPRPAGPPAIPHSVEGRAQCLLCHGQGGLKPVPADHSDRAESVCQLCHQQASN
ncbi:MAG: hypothetical protein HY669_04255 [Chloroflexi bacterium]|nr:hypothetical protein [Chloroflexota bacterium]